MEPIKELADDIYRERVLRARRTPIEQKIAAGGELFEGVCEQGHRALTCRSINEFHQVLLAPAAAAAFHHQALPAGMLLQQR